MNAAVAPHYSATTVGLRALVELAETLDISKISASAVAESAEAVERLQALRDELMDARHEAGGLGLDGPSLVAIEVLESEVCLRALLNQVAEMIRERRERLELSDRLEQARRDTAALEYRWFLERNRFENSEALEIMAEVVRKALGVELAKDLDVHELQSPWR